MFYLLMTMVVILTLISIIWHFKWHLSVIALLVCMAFGFSIHFAIGASFVTFMICCFLFIINFFNAYFIMRLITEKDFEELENDEQIKEMIQKIKENRQKRGK